MTVREYAPVPVLSTAARIANRDRADVRTAVTWAHESRYDRPMYRSRGIHLIWLALVGLLRAGDGRAQDDLLQLEIGDSLRRTAEISVGLDMLVDTTNGKEIAPREIFGVLGKPRVVLVGEEHTDSAFHDVQLHVVQSLHAAAVPLLIGLEMFPAASQAVLDRWVRGNLDETAFVEQSDWYSVWGYHWGYYREIFRFARAQQIRLIGLNEAPAASPAAEPAAVATESAADHRALVREFFEVDSPVHGGMTDAQLDQLAVAQARRDAVMAQHAAAALERNPLHTMVVLAGTGHVLYDLGIARQLPPAYRDAAASILPVPVEGEPQTVRASVAHIVWGVPESQFPRFPELGVIAITAEHGLDVLHVEEESPAYAADIRVGDKLTSVNGTTLWQRSDLSRAMADVAWGDFVTATLERDGAPVVIDIAMRR